MAEALAWMPVGLAGATPLQIARWGTQDLWIVLCGVWLIGGLMTRQSVRRQTISSRLWQIGIVLLGAWLIYGQGTGFAWLDAPAFPVTAAVALAGLAATLAGVAFAIWARVTLGANWSGMITVKEGHTLVRRGPYRFVRHPIYTGLLAAFLGTALTLGSVRSLLALPLLAFGFWLKSLMEERFMAEQFGEEYLRYRHEVRALVPFLF